MKLVKINVRLHEDDLDILRRAYPITGYNKAVREVVHQFADKLRKSLAKLDG